MAMPDEDMRKIMEARSAAIPKAQEKRKQSITLAIQEGEAAQRRRNERDQQLLDARRRQFGIEPKPKVVPVDLDEL